ncbi:MAG TPA: M56 family metallopeptidase [Sedimentisphaerales bacterium]|nr:M56 family metallopeptidase [Sedimentisphaerales bacterium]
MPVLETLFSQETIARLGWMLVHFLWQAAAVALLLAMLLRLLRRTGANARYAAACGALALMVALPLITMQVVEVPGPVAEAGPPLEIRQPQAAEPLPLVVQTTDELPPVASAPPEMVNLAVPIPWQTRIVAALEGALPYLVFGWLAGVFGLSAWHLGGWTQLHRLKHRMARQAGATIRATLDELATKLGVRRTVTLLESAIVEVPTVLGWLRPVILLPASAATGLNPDQLRAILAHELAHIRRHDYLANIVQTVVEILGFYHPAVWWVSSRIRIERENCCDDLAVQVCGSSLQYAKALTSLEEIGTDLALAASGGSLMARIARLLGRPAVDDRRFAWLPGLIALLLVVGVIIPAALVLGAPDTPLATPHVDLETTEGQAPNADATTVIERSPQDHVADSNETQVRTNWVIAKVRTETVLGRETLRRIGEILAGERPQIARELAATGQKTTLGQVLKTYVARQSLSQEAGTALIDLLKALDLTTKQARPSMTAADGRQFQLRTISEEWFFSSHRVRPIQAGEEPNLIRIEYGTIITGTARAENDASVTLDMAVSSSEPEPRADPNDLPVVHRMATSTTVNVPGDRYFSLLVESPNREARQAEEAESLLVMVKPSVARSASRPNDSPAAPTRQDESRPRHVLLDARVVEIEPARLTESGVEWSLPPGRPDKPDDDWTKGLQIGYLSDSAFTNSFLAALNRSAVANEANIVSNPQIVVQEGRPAQLRSGREQWFLLSDPPASALPPELRNIESGTILDVTCRIGDRNDITLEVAIEISSSVPGRVGSGSGSDLPIITRRMAKNSVTVVNGGTVALAGLTSRQARQTTKEIAIFITATRIPDIREVAAAPSGSELSDLLVRALSAEIAKAEQSLVVLRQTHMEANPDVVRQKTLLKALKDRLEDRRTELKREHESDLREALNRSREKPESPSSADADMRDSLRMAHRDSYVNSDPLIREWATSIAAMEKELIVLQQTHLPSHPILQQKQDALNDLYRRLEERRKMLQNGLDARIRPQG